ncbi:uncharacterized protein LOC131606282 [Vicia villosa]|uniref:uncharacterized protein LOC131606282 n=1 Tax=Vicia villosa TaxID=3911 RepID=UPI00273B87F7|nr:uncharacterized protein LOC131606282 [Vicia villosa]
MATKGCNKLPTIFDLNKSLQDIIEEVKRRNICLFDILPVVKSDLLVPLVEELLSYYDHEKNLFEINGHKLAVTLEDILYITGLPIRGKPIMKASKENGAFERVFGINNKKPCSIKRLKELAGNSNLDIDTRVKAALLVLIACVVIPTGDSHTIKGDFVNYVERLEEVDNYAWGASLLAFLYSGICKWKVDKQKIVIDGNLWVVLAFFLIRIPDLGEAIDLNLNLDGQQVPLLLPVVEAVSTISYNHKPTYLSKVQKILDTLTEEQICWKPYKLDLHRPILRDQKIYKLLLAPICCMSAVHYHTPHYVHKQFEELEVVDVNQLMWKPPIYKKRKGNRGPTAQTFLSDFELQQWNEGRLVINYLQGHEDNGSVDRLGRHLENVMDNQPDRHVDNVMVDQPEASNSRDVDSSVHVDLPKTFMVNQTWRNVENVMEDQPEGHVDILMVDQTETSISRDVDSVVHVDDQPETSIHADTQFEPHRDSSILNRRSLLDDPELEMMMHVGYASVDEKEDFEAQIVEEAGISLPDGFTELEVNHCPVVGNKNKNNSNNTGHLLWETDNSCLHNLDTSATESIDEPQEIQSVMVDHDCAKEASVVDALCDSMEKQGDEVAVSSIKDDKEAIQEHHDKPYSKLSDTIKSCSIKGTSAPSSSIKNVPPNLQASDVGLQTVFLQTTPLINTSNATVSSARHSCDPKSKKRKNVTTEVEDLDHMSMHLQSHLVSTPVVSNHMSPADATATPVVNVPLTTVEKSVESVSPLSIAAAASVGSNASLQAKLMADEALIFSGHESSCGTYFSEGMSNLGKATPASILKSASGIKNSSSIIGTAMEASRKRFKAASFAIKRAENVEAIVKAAELAEEAVSQAGRIVTMGDPSPLSGLVEAGPGGYWKTFQESSPMNVDKVDRPETYQISI